MKNLELKKEINIFTIGFSQKSAKTFFEALIKNGIRRLIDIRLNNKSQLAGFTKKDDLEYFLRVVGNIEYIHLAQLAPTKELLDNYKKKKISWEQYEHEFLNLIKKREIEKTLNPLELDYSCFLCSEPKPNKCHRRLLAEYLEKIWKDQFDIKIHHL